MKKWGDLSGREKLLVTTASAAVSFFLIMTTLTEAAGRLFHDPHQRLESMQKEKQALLPYRSALVQVHQSLEATGAEQLKLIADVAQAEVRRPSYYQSEPPLARLARLATETGLTVVKLEQANKGPTKEKGELKSPPEKNAHGSAPFTLRATGSYFSMVAFLDYLSDARIRLNEVTLTRQEDQRTLAAHIRGEAAWR